MAMPAGHGEEQHESDGASSSSLSSPQSSPPAGKAQSANDTIHVLPRTSFGGGGGGVSPGHLHSASAQASPAAALHHHHASTPAHAPNGHHAAHADGAATAGAPPKKVRKPRKPKEPQEGKAPADAKPKEKKPRKPREPKVKTEQGATGTTRKKPRTSQPVDEKPVVVVAPDQRAAAGPRQVTMEMFTQPQQQQHPMGGSAAMNMHAHPAQPQAQPPPPSQHHISSQPNAPIPISISRVPPPPTADIMARSSQPPTPRPISSGQNYDPIRGATIESRLSAPPPAPAIAYASQASPHINHIHRTASTSPSITSLIDPPQLPNAALSSTPHAPPASISQPAVLPSRQNMSPPARSPLPSHAPSTAASSTAGAAQSEPAPQAASAAVDGAMDVDPVSEPPAQPSLPAKMARAPSSSSSTAGPKAAKPSPPKGTGSGLLSSSDLFGGATPSSDANAERGPDIFFSIPLRQGNNVVNIAALIAKNYGHDAINPRAAAHRKRLREVAAAANRLEPGLADDIDLDSEQEAADNSNVEMGGMTDEGNAAPEKPVKRRKRKVEEYDKEDDFIDDTEMAWEQQARIASDGFFVYSGPLVKEQLVNGDAGAAPTTRGGRGRGRGSRGGRTAGTSSATHASLAAEREKGGKDANGATTPTSRGRGRGSRGGATGTGTKRGGRGSKKATDTSAPAATTAAVAAPPAAVPPPLAQAVQNSGPPTSTLQMNSQPSASTMMSGHGGPPHPMIPLQPTRNGIPAQGAPQML